MPQVRSFFCEASSLRCVLNTFRVSVHGHAIFSLLAKDDMGISLFVIFKSVPRSDQRHLQKFAKTTLLFVSQVVTQGPD